jgi:hypothetical protein
MVGSNYRDYESLGKDLVTFCAENRINIEDLFLILNDLKASSISFTDRSKNEWIKKVVDYCEYYNIPLSFLAETMSEPKVVPMIRGKAFEFSLMLILQNILPKNEWDVSKIIINAQSGLHDVDVQVIHRPTGKRISVECKLADKESFGIKDGFSKVQVKCMRSRTLGPEKVAALAPKLGIHPDVLTIHNDQYLPEDFDLVITSIGNAFYRTNKSTGKFEWKPTQREIEFLKKLSGGKATNLKDFAFNKIYVARSIDLAIGTVAGVDCTRRKCGNKSHCGFIPNYPYIYFDPRTYKPIRTWVELEDSLSLFQSLTQQVTSTEKLERIGELIEPEEITSQAPIF